MPALYEHGDVASLTPDLPGIQRTAIRCQQHQRNEVRQRYRDGAFDAAADFERQLLHVRAIRGVTRGRYLVRERYRLREPHVDFAVPGLHAGYVVDKPLQRLLALRHAVLHRDVIVHLRNLVEADGDGNEQRVLDGRPLVGLHDPADQSELRPQQLAGARPRAFYGPGQRYALRRQVVDEVFQDELVDLVVLETPPQEYRAGMPRQRPEAGEVHVDTGKNERLRPEAGVVQRTHEHEAVEARLVAPQFLELLQRLRVDVELRLEAARVHESRERGHPVQVAVGRAHCQFLQALTRVLFDVRVAALLSLREFPQGGEEALVPEDFPLVDLCNAGEFGIHRHGSALRTDGLPLLAQRLEVHLADTLCLVRDVGEPPLAGGLRRQHRDLDLRRSHHDAFVRQRVLRVMNDDRHDRHADLPRQVERAQLEGAQLAVTTARPFRRDHYRATRP